MKVMLANGDLTIDWADGTRQVVMFGGRGAGAWQAAACNGGVAGASRATAECPVILWDEVGAAPLPPLLARRG
jgi:hypothetical protein